MAHPSLKIRFAKNMVVLLTGLLLWLSPHAQFAKLTSVDNLLNQLKTSLSDTSRLRIMDDVGYYYIAKVGEYKIDLDSALDIIKRSATIVFNVNEAAWTGKYYLLQSKALREMGDSTNGRNNLNKALQTFKVNKLSELEGDGLRDLNQYYPCRTEEEAAVKIPILQRMVTLYELAQAKIKQAEGLTMLGDLYTFMDSEDQGIVSLEKALSVYRSVHYEQLQVVYDLLGSCYLGVGDLQKAISYGLLAVQTAHQVQDTGMIVTLYNRLALSFFHANMLTEASLYFNKALYVAKKIGDTSSIILLGSHLAEVFLQQQKPEAALQELKHIENDFGALSLMNKARIYASMATALTDLGRYAEGFSYLKKMIIVDRLIGYNFNQYNKIVHYYIATRNYRKVAAYADSLELNNKKRNTKLNGELVHLWRFKADSAMGKLKAAINEYQLYKKMEDTVFSEKSKKEIQRLNILYESDRKDNDIKSNQLYILALEKEDRLKTAEIKTTRFTRNMIIFGTCMLLLLLGLLYNQYRIKQKNNKNLLIKQQAINDQNTQLQHLVEDKEWLVKEIHHRVKNNLQLVMSLLNTQADYSNNEQSFAAIRESRQRMFAMSLIHQKLYQADQMTLVDMANYIPELVDFLKDSFADGERVRFELQIASIELDVNQAVPLGLILNELVTNSIKYAFEKVTRGIIRIYMSIEMNGAIHLAVSDNGIGWNPDANLTREGTMGMQLIASLVEQIGGKVHFKNQNGLLVELVFEQKLNPHQIKQT